MTLNRLMINEIENILGKENIFPNEPMSNHTTFKVGGCADLLVSPKSEDMFIRLMSFLVENDISHLVIGNGSNLLVKDNGIRGVVVKLANNLTDINYEGEIVTAQAGILMSRLAKELYKKSLAGFEFASGIPGTLGGAIFMNAGAYGGNMSDIVIETRYLDLKTGEVKTLSNKEHNFSYRYSFYQDNPDCYVLSVKMKFSIGDKSKIKEVMDDLAKRRRDKQPLEFPSAGSTFKRPKGNYASKLIEECGLKGLSCGGAMVSPKHSGFIINTGNATASDILTLIDMVKNKVYEQTGYVLNEEVRVVGE